MDPDIQLYEALDERDRHIEDLEAELERGPHAEVQAIQEENGALASDIDKHRDELIKCHDTIAELQVQTKQLRLDNEGLVGEKLQLEDQVSAHKLLLDTQKSRLTAAAKSTEGAKKQQKDDNQILHRLELENQR